MRRHLGTITGALFVLSLIVPAIVVEDRPLFGGDPSERAIFGAQCVAIGFFVWPGWIANPLLVLSWVIRGFAAGRRRHLILATWLAVLALGSALLAPFLLAESTQIPLRYLHVGYYLWLASIAVAALDAFLASSGARSDATTETSVDNNRAK